MADVTRWERSPGTDHGNKEPPRWAHRRCDDYTLFLLCDIKCSCAYRDIAVLLMGGWGGVGGGGGGVGGGGGCPEGKTLLSAFANLHDTRKRCFAAC